MMQAVDPVLLYYSLEPSAMDSEWMHTICCEGFSCNVNTVPAPLSWMLPAPARDSQPLHR